MGLQAGEQENKAHLNGTEPIAHPSVSQGRMARGDPARQVEGRAYPRFSVLQGLDLT